MKLKQQQKIDEVRHPGDYLIAANRVILACPSCGGVMSLSHTIEQEKPLTLTPSVVGPPETFDIRSQVLGPCGHHFFIRNGIAVDVA